MTYVFSHNAYKIKDKYKLIVKLVITVVGIVFCAQTHLIFSEPWFGANSGVMDGLAAAEVNQKLQYYYSYFTLSLPFLIMIDWLLHLLVVKGKTCSTRLAQTADKASPLFGRGFIYSL